MTSPLIADCSREEVIIVVKVALSLHGRTAFPTLQKCIIRTKRHDVISIPGRRPRQRRAPEIVRAYVGACVCARVCERSLCASRPCTCASNNIRERGRRHRRRPSARSCETHVQFWFAKTSAISGGGGGSAGRIRRDYRVRSGGVSAIRYTVRRLLSPRTRTVTAVPPV